MQKISAGAEIRNKHQSNRESCATSTNIFPTVIAVCQLFTLAEYSLLP